MSDYTTQLRFICESYAGRTAEGSQATDVDDIIALARPHLFDFEYPIFDASYKPELESKIMNHFYTQEIGQETVGLFKQRLKTKMREIMPYYNQLYMSERLKFDPFKNADYIDTHNTNSTGDRRGTNDNIAGFSNSSINDIDNTHIDQTDSTDTSTGTNHEDGSGRDNKDSTGAKTGAGTQNSTRTPDLTTRDDKAGSESSTSERTNKTEMKGAVMHSDTPPVAMSTIYKEADTPLGGLSGDGTTAISGTNNGYLSKVTETITNANSDTDHRKAGFTTDRYGYKWNTDTEKVEADDRYDKTKEDNSSQVAKNENNINHLGGTDKNDVLTTTTETDTNSEQGTNSYEKDGSHTDVANGTTLNNGSYHTDNDTVSNGTSNSNTVNTEHTQDKQDYFGKVFGKVGSETYSEMLQKFRATFLNIDMDVIHELEPLFMMIW